MSAPHPYRRAGALLVAATLLIGIAWILVQPPFEGFDETMHYSSIREIADTHALPRYGNSRIARFVEEYGARAPLPLGQQHGVQAARPMSYADFMQDDAARIAFAAYFASEPGLARRFEPGSSLNWQAQHPPLYYVILSPLMRATDGMSFVAQMMALRVASWLMAVAGIAIGVWGTAQFIRSHERAGRAEDSRGAVADGGAPRAEGDLRRALPTACLAYPVFVPMFFPEFARLGNDALCLLIFGAVWALLLQTLGREPSAVRASALGACLGAGLLTKAFFIPITAGAMGCLAWSAWRGAAPGSRRTHMLRDVAIVAAAALLIGGWWYGVAYAQHGVLTGSNDLIALDRQGGLLAGLKENFAWRHVGRGVAAFIVTGYFGGTWTLARLPEWMYAPGLIAIALMCVTALRMRRDARLNRLLAPMLWMLLPMLGGMAYHLLSRIAEGTRGHGTPGWYMSILAPACAVPLGAGMIAIAGWRRAAWIAPALWLWMVAFVGASFWLHAALYAGVAVKDMQTRHIACPDGWLSLLDVAEIHARLAVFGWPIASMACLGAGTLMAAMAWPPMWRKTAHLAEDSLASR